MPTPGTNPEAGLTLSHTYAAGTSLSNIPTDANYMDYDKDGVWSVNWSFPATFQTGLIFQHNTTRGVWVGCRNNQVQMVAGGPAATAVYTIGLDYSEVAGTTGKLTWEVDFIGDTYRIWWNNDLIFQAIADPEWGATWRTVGQDASGKFATNASTSMFGLPTNALPSSQAQSSLRYYRDQTSNWEEDLGTTGTASGTLPITGTSTAVTTILGTAAGVLALTGTSQGALTAQGQASGELPLAGTAEGAGRLWGTASGSLLLFGDSEAATKVAGQASGTLPLGGFAAEIVGTAAGAFTFTGQATGRLGEVVDYTLRLDRMQRQVAYFGKEAPTAQMQLLWQRHCEGIEKAFGGLAGRVELLEKINTAQAAAQAANDKAETLATQTNIADSYTDPPQVAMAADDGTITIDAHERVYGDGNRVDVDGGSLTGFSSGDAVTVYYDDAARKGGAVAYKGTTDPVAQTGNRHIAAQVTIPDVGQPPSTGTGPSAPGYTPQPTNQKYKS